MNLTNFLLYLIFSLVLFTACSTSESEISVHSSEDQKSHEIAELKMDTVSYFCDAETTENGFFLSSSIKFRNAGTASTEFAHSGKQSSKVFSTQQYGLSTELYNLKKGQAVNAQVWIKREPKSKQGSLVISGSSGLIDNSYYTVRTEGEWQLIENNYKVFEDEDTLKVYVSNHLETPVYFDDLTIRHQKNTALPPITENAIRLFIPERSQQKIDSFIQHSLEDGIISDGYKKYVKAFMLMGEDSVSVKVRLKGDWTDHLKTPKFSLRVQMKGDYAYNGMKTFSIQNPETRSFMHEWFIHKLFEYEDVLTTRYSFTPVEINGVNKGVYAVEEHFQKQLVESRKRREGPIIKLDESGFWQENYDRKVRGIDVHSPIFESAEVLAFGQKKVMSNPVSKGQFETAQFCAKQYKDKKSNPGSFLSLDKFSKYLGILDAGNIHHAYVWINQRQYFNPISNRLEPVAYDCYQDIGLLRKNDAFIGVGDYQSKRRGTHQNLALMNDNGFKNAYLSFIKKITADGYYEDFISTLESEQKTMERLIKYEYPFYDADPGFIKENLEQMKAAIPELEAFVAERRTYNFETDVWTPLSRDDIFRPDAALKIFTEKDDDVHRTFKLGNFHRANIKVLGYSTNLFPDKMVPLKSPLTLNYFKSGEPKWAELKLRADTRYFYYEPANQKGKIVKRKVSEMKYPLSAIDINGDYEVLPTEVNEDGFHVLKKGNYKFTKNQVFTGEKLIIEAGTMINLVEGAGFISYAPVEMIGSKAERININSQDKSASGFNVICDYGKSVIKFTNFTDMNAMNKNNWTLTGACTLYGHEVEMADCGFLRNYCEDALNMVSCEINVSRVSIQKSLSDGFDADFCNGTVTDCSFQRTGNDAIDFSGSEITISGCTINIPGDKGISGGENSRLTIKDCTILNAVIGIASKDLSQLDVSNTSLEKCQYGYAIYRKKPEYGPASITLSSPTEAEIEQRILIDLNSTITEDSKTTTGDERIDVDALYAAFK